MKKGGNLYSAGCHAGWERSSPSGSTTSRTTARVTCEAHDGAIDAPETDRAHRSGHSEGFVFLVVFTLQLTQLQRERSTAALHGPEPIHCKRRRQQAHFFFGLPAGLLFDLTAPALRGAGLAALPLAALATFFLRLSASVDMLACLTACDVSMAVPTLLSGNIRLKTCCERAVSCAATTTSGEAVHNAAHASGEWRAAVAP